MQRRLDERIDEAIGRWIAAVERRARIVVGLALLVTIVLGLYAARNLGVNADPDAMIASDVPFRVREDAFQKRFHTFRRAILVVVDGASPARVRRAADTLAGRLSTRHDLFASVDAVGGGPFFARNALLYLSTDQLEELVDRLALAQPLMAELTKDSSLVGISSLLRQAVSLQREGADVGLDLTQALDRVSVALEGAQQGHEAPDPWSEAFLGGGRSEAATLRVIALRAKLDFSALLAAGPAVEAIRAEARALGLDASYGVHVRVTGDPVLNYEELIEVRRQAKLVAVAAFVLAGLSLWVGLRSAGVIAASLASLLVALVASNAFCAYAIGQLNQISTAFNVLIVGLGTEFGIHVCMRYGELVRAGRPRAEALVETGTSLGSSLLFSAGTTAIGFFVFLPTDYTGVAQLGLITGVGILISFVCSVTLLPALLTLTTSATPYMPPANLPIGSKLRHLPVRFARPIRWATLALAGVAVLLLPSVEVDHNPVNLRDPGTESVQAFEDLLENSRTAPWTIDVEAPDLATAQREAERIARLPSVEHAITLADYVPKDQAEKRAILQAAAFFLPPEPPSRPAPTASAQRDALASLAAELDATAAARAAPPLAASAKRLRAAISAFLAGPAASADAAQAAAAWAAAQRAVVGSLPEQIEDLRRLLAPEEVTLERLPASLREQMLAEDGAARISVAAKGDLRRSEVLARFVDEVSALAPEATGNAVALVGWSRVTLGALFKSLAIAIFCMAIFLIGISRRAWDTLLAFVPMALAVLFTCALMGGLGKPFTFANVIVMPMLVGMGIDNGIHLVHRHRTNPEEVDVLSSSTARAVFFSCATTILSFASLGMAGHRGMASLGQLLTLGVGMTLLCYVGILPAILAWDDARRRRRRTSASGGS